MSNLTRWEPAREMMTLREAMDRLFDDAFTRPLGLAREAGAARQRHAEVIFRHAFAAEYVIQPVQPHRKHTQQEIRQVVHQQGAEIHVRKTHHRLAGLPIQGRWVDVRDPEVLASLSAQ